jgi:hypothetical protein
VNRVGPHNPARKPRNSNDQRWGLFFTSALKKGSDSLLMTLADLCPDCGRPYGFALESPPTSIGEFQVVRALGRGFYASTYVAEKRGLVTRRSVLKVSPVSFYKFFKGKDFAEECRLHQFAAEGAEHIVGLEDAFETEVDFAGTLLPCYVSELKHVDGEMLSSYLAPDTPLSAITAAQIAIDLMRIRMELERRELNHNDLHADNVVVEGLSWAHGARERLCWRHRRCDQPL